MGLFHRKLCSSCYYPPISPPPPIPVYVDEENQSPTTTKHTKISTYLIISFAIVATAFFLLCCFAIYSKFFSSRRRRQPLSQQQTQDNFPDEEEEEGPVVDHPIWYIRTTGLQQSVIGAITVCKYKKGEGLIEGTECSVCLSEFEENENLRLLPKCNHAFHLPCIDTWLRSHTNCPLCRAPVVSDPTRIPSLEPNNAFDLSVENSGMENSIENSVTQLRNNEEEEQGQENEVCEGESSGSGVINVQPRRSVSLDSSEASKINLALQSVLSVESQRYSNRDENLGNSAKVRSSSWARYLQSAPSSMKRSRSVSWYSRSQKKPNPPLRSF